MYYHDKAAEHKEESIQGQCLKERKARTQASAELHEGCVVRHEENHRL